MPSRALSSPQPTTWHRRQLPQGDTRRDIAQLKENWNFSNKFGWDEETCPRRDPTDLDSKYGGTETPSAPIPLFPHSLAQKKSSR